MAVAFAILIFAFVRESVALTKVGDIQLIHSCAVGDEVHNEHVTCICTLESMYRCVHKYHSVVNMAIELDELKEISCQPNKLYEYDGITCICTKNGTWPHNKCAELLQSLPESELVKKTCEPNSYATVDCNVCRCDANGNIDKQHCTNNTCASEAGTSDPRRSTEGTKLYGDCECGTWYSLAPCQFCYCVNRNKLVCNTGTRLMTNQMYLQLGAYNMHICGKKLVKELNNLVRDNQDSLREGENVIDDDEESEMITTSKPRAIPRPSAKPVKSDSKVDKSIKRDKESADGDDSSLNSDDNISEQQANDPKRNVYKQHPSTQLASQDDYENQESEQAQPAYEPAIGRQNNDNRLVDKSDNEASVEMPDVGLLIPTPKDQRTVIPKSPDSEDTAQAIKNIGQRVQFSLPMMLDKVFKMALRKSMVTVSKDMNCTPGSVETAKCNTCFCLKNSKMLCTKNKCD